MGKFEKFKAEEFLGDKILDVIFSDFMIEDGANRIDLNSKLRRYTNNRALSIVFEILNLELHADDVSYFKNKWKQKGNSVEQYIWKQFKTNGYEHVKRILYQSYLILKNEPQPDH